MIRLAVRCRPELADRVLAELTALAPNGVEEERGGEYVEFAVYGPPGELPAVPELEAAAGDALVEISSTEVPEDWADRWRDFHRPVQVGGRLVVRPSWTTAEEDGGARRGRLEVVIDPGQAFGTGAHATTRMCLEHLLELAGAGEAGGPLADVGTGSGVIAIAAAKLGWSPVTGVDHEPAAIEAAAANARANGVELELMRLNVREHPAPAAGTLVANLTAPLLRELAARLDRGHPPRHLICSGLLEAEEREVLEAFEPRGLRPVDALRSGEWVGLRLGRVSR